MPDELFNIRLDSEDRALLEACSAKEKLSKSDIVRRALRQYAATIGVRGNEQPSRKKTKRK